VAGKSSAYLLLNGDRSGRENRVNLQTYIWAPQERRGSPQLVVIRRGDYGYDAPYFPVIFGFLSVAAGLGATMSWRQGVIRPAMQMTLYFVFFLANTSSFLYTTRRGKFLEWDRILDHLHLRGDEGVLDMGCGRGAVLTAVARRLTTGRVTGIDIWRTKDQSGNARDVIEKQKLAPAHMRTPCQGRGNGIHSRDELRDQQESHAIPDETILRLPNARIRFQRHAAEESENLRPAAPPDLKPCAVRDQTSQNTKEKNRRGTQMARSRKSATDQQQGDRRNRQRALLRKNPEEQNGVPVPDHELGCFVHRISDSIRRLTIHRST
jgi:hypothetical protein